MSDKQYTEPTNEQLASFLVVYGQSIFGDTLMLNAPMLEMIMDSNPEFRATGLRHHRAFQENIDRLHQTMLDGKLQCQHIRPNGKNCPNYNEPGSYYCGLHKEDEL